MNLIKTVLKILTGVTGRLILMFAWLIPLSLIIDEFYGLYAILLGIVLTIIFYFIHDYSKKPNRWTYERTQCAYSGVTDPQLPVH